MAEDIDTRVMTIISKVAAVSHDFDTLDRHAPLTGSPLHMEGYELVYIVLELMEAFRITFTSEDFDLYGFNTPEGIIAAVKRHVTHG